MSNQPLRDRLLLGILDALTDTDPVIVVAIGDSTLHIDWKRSDD